MSFIVTTGQNIQPREAIQLYIALRWGTEAEYGEESMQRALDRTSTIISARNSEGKLVGLLRVFSDGEITTYIADIAVHPDYQRQGIGEAMMEEVKKQYSKTGIYLDSFQKEEKFFQKCGYTKREMMTVFSKKFQ